LFHPALSLNLRVFIYPVNGPGGVPMSESAKIIAPERLFKKIAFIFGAWLVSGFCGIPLAAQAADAEAVTINTNFTVFTPPVRLSQPAREARASVVLMEGGNGLLDLDAAGEISGAGNFLIRSANLFLRNGLNVMMADAAPAFPGGLADGDRLGATHAAELQGFINAAISRWGKPVWVVGTSNGSISTVTAGGFQPALTGLRGLVMTSPVTVLPTSAEQATFNLLALRVTLPALVVWHQNDHCSVSPPTGAAALFAVLPSNDKASASFRGGHSVATDPCGPFSEHGYAGIEEEVVNEIAKYIRR
jgi:hypothetical protein